MKPVFLSARPQAQGLRKGQMRLATLQERLHFASGFSEVGEKRPNLSEVRNRPSFRAHRGNKV